MPEAGTRTRKGCPLRCPSGSPARSHPSARAEGGAGLWIVIWPTDSRKEFHKIFGRQALLYRCQAWRARRGVSDSREPKINPTRPNGVGLTTVVEAMTMTNASPSARGRRAKFTPQAILKIKELVAQGASREEIASLLGVTVGSLQVTCSRLGISLRRKILHSGPTPHLRDPKGRAIPFQGSVGVAYAGEQKTEEVLRR